MTPGEKAYRRWVPKEAQAWSCLKPEAKAMWEEEAAMPEPDKAPDKAPAKQVRREAEHIIKQLVKEIAELNDRAASLAKVQAGKERIVDALTERFL